MIFCMTFSLNLCQQIEYTEFMWSGFSRNLKLFISYYSENTFGVILTLCKKCPNEEFFQDRSSCIRAEYGDLRSKPLYSAQIQEIKDQKKFPTWTLFTQCECILVLLGTVRLKVIQYNIFVPGR